MIQAEYEDLRKVREILEEDLELTLRKMEDFMVLLDMQLEYEKSQTKETDFILRVLKNGLDQIKMNRVSALRHLENLG